MEMGTSPTSQVRAPTAGIFRNDEFSSGNKNYPNIPIVIPPRNGVKKYLAYSIFINFSSSGHLGDLGVKDLTPRTLQDGAILALLVVD